MKKIVVFLLALATAFSLVGCKPPAVEDTETNVIIEMYSQGYGSDVMNAWARRFEEKNEGVTVTVIPNPTLLDQAVQSKLGLGVKNPVDIFFSATLNFRDIIDKGPSYLQGYDYETAFADLSDVYDTVIDASVPGDNKKVKKKMHPNYIEHYTMNGKQYAMPYISEPNGFVYNADFFEENGWTIPRTTNEMIELVTKISEEGYTPFVWPGQAGYWNYPVMTWWAQYEGEQGMADFWSGKDRYGSYSAEIFRQYGREAAFKVMEDLVYREKNSFPGSIEFTNDSAQMEFYKEANKIVMMPSGGWLENEMKLSGYEPGSLNVGIMKTPVLSDVLQKDTVDPETGDIQFAPRFKTITTEGQLRELIKLIDEEKPCPNGVDPDEYAQLAAIRNYSYSTGLEFAATIPAYSNAMEYAKKFLVFTASDEASQILYDMIGGTMPYYSNVQRKENETTFTKTKLDIAENARYVSSLDATTKLFYKTDLKFFMSGMEAIGNPSESDSMRADELIKEQFDLVQASWSTHYASFVGQM